jgi:hypothetical protein
MKKLLLSVVLLNGICALKADDASRTALVNAWGVETKAQKNEREIHSNINKQLKEKIEMSEKWKKNERTVKYDKRS